MIKFYTIAILAVIITCGPLCLAAIIFFKYRKLACQPRWIPTLMLSITFACAAIIIYIPSFPMLASILIICGMTLCAMFVVASIIRRYCEIDFTRAYIISAFAMLPLLMWIDFRFRVVVQDSKGRAVKIQNEHISLHHPPESYFQSYIQVDGIRLKKGTFYFGLIRWLEYKDRWTFSGVGDAKWESARWSRWPKTITVE